LEDGKRLSGYQKIRVQDIRTAGYQVKEQKVGWGRVGQGGWVHTGPLQYVKGVILGGKL
jgi:hypothetical protein